MKRRVVYLMSGRPHLPYLVVSLYTLRKHWDGPIYVYAWPESSSIVWEIANDGQLRLSTPVEREPKYRRKDGVRGNAQFLDKIALMQELPSGTNLYLDSDTIINGDLSPLFDKAEESGMCLTQFNDWFVRGGIVEKRVRHLIDREPVDQDAVQALLRDANWPSVNGGVFACRPDSPALPVWYDWTLACKDLFIADETTLHAIMAHFAPQGKIKVLRGGAYNLSPKVKFRPEGLKDEDVVVFHFHGDSNVRPNKSQFGYDLWWPVYQECLAKNVGGIAEWGPEVAAENKHMRKLIGEE